MSASTASVPGPIPDKSYDRIATGLCRFKIAWGITAKSSGSCWPSGPSQSLDYMEGSAAGIPLFQLLVNPSVSRSQLCKAQQVRKILSAKSTPDRRMPVFRIRNRPLRMPNVHSTSFRIDSSQAEKRISTLLLVVFIGGTVVGHARYPLSTNNRAPW